MSRLETISELCGALSRLGVSYHRLGSLATGQAVIIPAGARVLALSAPADDRNVMWLNPGLAECRSRADVEKLGAGGIGGLRVWQAPEAAYMWDGAPELAAFSNYRVQPAMDPGPYVVSEAAPQRCVVEGTISLRAHRSSAALTFSVRRIVELRPLPVSLQTTGTRGVSLRLQHHLRLLRADGPDAIVDLWHLLQLPAGTTVGAHLRPGANPVPYFNADKIGELENQAGFLQWRTDGRRMSKIGLRVGDVLGGPYSTREDGDRVQCFFWQVPRARTAAYVDAPPHHTANDQLVQFWDGFGFCEVEYHTPGVSVAHPEVMDASELHFVEQTRGSITPLELLRSVQGTL